jgi:hypothetical protein
LIKGEKEMKIFTMICAAALAICGIAGAASSTDRLKVHFDKPVMVGATTLPAGDVTIQRLDSASEEGILMLRSESGVEAAVLTNRLDAADAPKASPSVQLTRHGDNYELDSVWLSGTQGFQILEPAR